MKRQLLPTLLLLTVATLLGGAKGCNDPDPVECVCAQIFDPVCASDGRTYGNACEAECAGLTVESNDECAFTQTGAGSTCTSDDSCNTGQSCIEFFGFTGQPMRECHVDCDTPDEGSAICPSGLQCVTVADGPGSICVE